MIVRILDDGQYDVPDAELAALDDLDTALLEAVEAGDDTRFDDVIGDMVAKIHGAGRRLPAEQLSPSEIIVPGVHTTRSRVAELFERGELT